jgi:hypothetical protein
MSLESKLQEASQDFQKLQIDLAHAVEARQQLDAQLSENKQVQEVIHGRLFKESRKLDSWYSGICAAEARKYSIQINWACSRPTRSSGSKKQC